MLLEVKRKSHIEEKDWAFGFLSNSFHTSKYKSLKSTYLLKIEIEISHERPGGGGEFHVLFECP